MTTPLQRSRKASSAPSRSIKRKTYNGKNAFQHWASEFSTSAKADDFAIFRDHLLWLGLPSKPESMLNATIQAVVACIAYHELDGQSSEPFLKLQKYDPKQTTRARYVLTFQLNAKVFARVLLTPKLEGLDLAELYGHPWQDYRSVGFQDVWISRLDRTDFKGKELCEIEKCITNDLRYDYAEDELGFWFEKMSKGIALLHAWDP